MATRLKHTLAACLALLAAASLAPVAQATPETHHGKMHKHMAKKAEPAKDVFDDKNNPEPDITDTVTTDYNCELGNKITIYTNEKDTDHMALRWKHRLHRMNRIATTTGAQRFENPVSGIIWIGIPSKGILLDSKLNRQLANECKSAEQSKPLAATSPEAKQG